MSGSIKIPFSNLGRQYKGLQEELLDITNAVWETGQVLQGPNTVKFEEAIAARCSRKYGVAVNSGTQALVFSLMALAPGEENSGSVIAPAISFYATLNAIMMSGLLPQFVDVDAFGCIDPAATSLAIEKLDPAGTNAIMAVDLFGGVADYAQLETLRFFAADHGIPIIEDAAQSFGASRYGKPAGSFGDISILSFDPTKNLPNYGSGGMLLTDDYDTAQYLENLRNNGTNSGYAYIGTNSKMSEADCAQMLVKLKRFDAWQDRRRDIAAYYDANLLTAKHLHHPDVSPSYHKYVIYPEYRSHTEDQLLENFGIQTKKHYPTILPHCQSYEMFMGKRSSETYIVAEDISLTALSLPIYPELTDYEVEYVVDSVNRIHLSHRT